MRKFLEWLRRPAQDSLRITSTDLTSELINGAPCTVEPTLRHEGSDDGSDIRMPSRALAFTIGQRIADHFVIQRTLGAGGMGIAYLAHHDTWNIDVALKVPHAEFIRDRKLYDLIVREAEAWTDLGLHPHIVYCYCVLPISDVPVIVTEYLDGGSLRELMAAPFGSGCLRNIHLRMD